MWCLQEPSVVQCSHVCTLWLVGQGRRAQPRPGGALSLVEERRGAVIGRVRRWLVACRTRVGYVANKFLLCAAASMPSCQPAANRCIPQSTSSSHPPPHQMPRQGNVFQKGSIGESSGEEPWTQLESHLLMGKKSKEITTENFALEKYMTMLQRTEFSCHNSHGVE